MVTLPSTRIRRNSGTRPRGHVLRPDLARALELLSQRLSQGLEQHPDPILTALAHARNHRLMVHILTRSCGTG